MQSRQVGETLFCVVLQGAIVQFRQIARLGHEANGESDGQLSREPAGYGTRLSNIHVASGGRYSSLEGGLVTIVGLRNDSNVDGMDPTRREGLAANPSPTSPEAPPTAGPGTVSDSSITVCVMIRSVKRKYQRRDARPRVTWPHSPRPRTTTAAFVALALATVRDCIHVVSPF